MDISCMFINVLKKLRVLVQTILATLCCATVRLLYESKFQVLHVMTADDTACAFDVSLCKHMAMNEWMDRRMRAGACRDKSC